MERTVAFSYGDDEHMPVILGFGHNLKEENVCRCISTILQKDDRSMLVQKKMTHKNKDIEILVNYSLANDGQTFVEGKLTMEGKEYNIHKFATYSSLQIQNYCYDDIHVVRLPCNIFI